jgi:hypothetical protein
VKDTPSTARTKLFFWRSLVCLTGKYFFRFRYDPIK